MVEEEKQLTFKDKKKLIDSPLGLRRMQLSSNIQSESGAIVQ